MSSRDFSWGKGGRCVWLTTYLVVPKVEKIWGLNLHGTPRANSACRGMTFTFTYLYTFTYTLITYNYVREFSAHNNVLNTSQLN